MARVNTNHAMLEAHHYETDGGDYLIPSLLMMGGGIALVGGIIARAVAIGVKEAKQK